MPGSWTPLVPLPLIAVHLVHVCTGQLLVWNYGNHQHGQQPSEHWTEDIWLLDASQPGNNQLWVKRTLDTGNIFCSGHTQLADGRVFINGGHEGNDVGTKLTHLFNPTIPQNPWTLLHEQMHHPRWYPSSTLLPDGTVYTGSGTRNGPADWARVPEIWRPGNPVGTWTQYSNAELAQWYYPNHFIGPDGNLFYTGQLKWGEASLASRFF
jgi:galactose oxidase